MYNLRMGQMHRHGNPSLAGSEGGRVGNIWLLAATAWCNLCEYLQKYDICYMIKETYEVAAESVVLTFVPRYQQC